MADVTEDGTDLISSTMIAEDVVCRVMPRSDSYTRGGEESRPSEGSVCESSSNETSPELVYVSSEVNICCTVQLWYILVYLQYNSMFLIVVFL